MKKTMMNVTPVMGVVLAVLLIWGCTAAPQNVNLTQNQNANSTQNTNSAIPIGDILSTACSEGNIDQRREKVYQKIKENIEKSSLETQYAAGKIKFDVVKAPGTAPDTLYLYIEGRIIGRDEFDVLTDILDNFVNAKCTSRVVFVRPGTIPLKAGASLNDDPGFEWTACDYPNEPCPGGECRAPGTCPDPTPDVNTNTNSKPKTNANTNSNSNR
jgi:hypothetical protein